MECVLHAKRTLGLAPSAPHTRPSAPHTRPSAPQTRPSALHTRPSAGQCMVEVEQEGSRQASVPAPAARASKPRLSIQAPTQLVYLIKSGYYIGLHKHRTQTHTLTLQCSTNRKVRYALKEKNDIIWEFFPTWGGVFPNPKTFVNLQVFFCMPNSF